MSKKLAAAHAAFRRRVAASIQSFGAVESDGLYEFTLATPAGDVHISIHDYSIMCRFDDVEAGKQFTSSVGCGSFYNPYSGKWNWHFANDVQTLNSECELVFIYYVQRLLALPTNHLTCT